MVEVLNYTKAGKSIPKGVKIFISKTENNIKTESKYNDENMKQ